MSVEIRPLRESDKIDAQKLLPPDAAEPDWGHCYVVLDNNKVIGIMGTEVRLAGLAITLVAEPLYMSSIGGYCLVAMGELDGIIRGIAAFNGLAGYGFSVRNINHKFQDFCEKHLPIKLVNTSGEARYYWRAF